MARKKEEPKIQDPLERKVKTLSTLSHCGWLGYGIVRAIQDLPILYQQDDVHLWMHNSLKMLLTVAFGLGVTDSLILGIFKSKKIKQAIKYMLFDFGSRARASLSYYFGLNRLAEQYIQKMNEKKPDDLFLTGALAFIQAKNENYKGSLDNMLKAMFFRMGGQEVVAEPEDHPLDPLISHFKSKERALYIKLCKSILSKENAYEAYTELKKEVPSFDESRVFEMVLLRYLNNNLGFERLAKEVIGNIDLPGRDKKEEPKQKPQVVFWEAPEYPSALFAVKEADSSSVKKQHYIEQKIHDELDRRITPFPLGIFNKDGRDFYFQEFTKADTLESSWKKAPNHDKLRKVVQNLGTVSRIMTPLKARLEDYIKPIGYRAKIAEFLETAGKGSIDQLLWALDTPIKYLEESSTDFCHGDFHPGNIVGEQIIDWEHACLSTPFYDLIYLLDQPAFGISQIRNYKKERVFKEETGRTHLDYFTSDQKGAFDFDPNCYFLTGLYVSLMISSRSSKWLQREGTKEREDFERHFFSKMLNYLDDTQFGFDKKKVKEILIKEFPEVS